MTEVGWKNKRKKGWNRGAWQVQRERGQITDTRPPAPFHEARSVDSLLPGLLKKMKLETDSWMSVMQEEWPKLVGSDVARHSRPGRLDAGNLAIYVDHSVWLSELSRYGKGLLLKKIQDRFESAKIRRLSFQLDPDISRSSGGMSGKIRSTSF